MDIHIYSLSQYYETIEKEYRVHTIPLFYPESKDIPTFDRTILDYERIVLCNFIADSFKKQIESEKEDLIKYYDYPHDVR